VFGNSNVGIHAQLDGDVLANAVYSNSVGVLADVGGLLGCRVAEAHAHRHVRNRADAGEVQGQARRQARARAGDARQRHVVEEAARAPGQHREPLGLGRRRRQQDAVYAAGLEVLEVGGLLLGRVRR
jgi:hypothetical protein